MCHGNPFCTCHQGPQGGTREYGEPGTPNDQGFIRRFIQGGRVEKDTLYEATTGYPQIKTGAFREASPTGKPGGAVQRARLAPQPLESADVRPYIFQQPPALPQGTKMIMTGSIDPWETVNGKAPGISQILIGSTRKAVG